jgi:hypothetical protein
MRCVPLRTGTVSVTKHCKCHAYHDPEWGCRCVGGKVRMTATELEFTGLEELWRPQSQQGAQVGLTWTL